MTHILTKLCPSGHRENAKRALSEAVAGLDDARAMHVVAAQHKERLTRAIERNHFREAVEYQLRGGRA